MLPGTTCTYTDLGQQLAELQNQYDRQNIVLQKLLAKDQYADVAPYEIMLYDPLAGTFALNGQTYDRLVVEDIQMKQQQVVIARQSIEMVKQTILKAQQNVELAQQNVNKARQSVDQANLALEQAAKAVEVAQKQLDSAAIKAPFNGVIASLDVKQNDYIVTPGLSAGTPIVIVDHDSLEIKASVDEIDIANIQPGQKALVTMDAMPGVQIEAKVTSIDWLPIVKPENSGVVVYLVKVGFNGAPPALGQIRNERQCRNNHQ